MVCIRCPWSRALKLDWPTFWRRNVSGLHWAQLVSFFCFPRFCLTYLEWVKEGNKCKAIAVIKKRVWCVKMDQRCIYFILRQFAVLWYVSAFCSCCSWRPLNWCMNITCLSYFLAKEKAMGSERLTSVEIYLNLGFSWVQELWALCRQAANIILYHKNCPKNNRISLMAKYWVEASNITQTPTQLYVPVGAEGQLHQQCNNI